MKNIFYLAALLISGNVSSQLCNHTIQPHAEFGGVGNIHIFADTMISNPQGSVYYICSGVSVTINASGGSNYYLEDGVSLTLN
ncbi:MAG: hypothetical protein HRT57_05945 [Crocinitomicaceae bacterium]|nr:hypothetical protein [Crocinitomicaceae bacterium]